MNKSVSAIMVAYNEENTLGTVIDKLKKIINHFSAFDLAIHLIKVAIIICNYLFFHSIKTQSLLDR